MIKNTLAFVRVFLIALGDGIINMKKCLLTIKAIFFGASVCDAAGAVV